MRRRRDEGRELQLGDEIVLGGMRYRVHQIDERAERRAAVQALWDRSGVERRLQLAFEGDAERLRSALVVDGTVVF